MKSKEWGVYNRNQWAGRLCMSFLTICFINQFAYSLPTSIGLLADVHGGITIPFSPQPTTGVTALTAQTPKELKPHTTQFGLSTVYC